MARGDARAPIFLEDAAREAFCAELWRVAERFQWRVWAYCLMGNHYHLLVETLQPTLSRGMREVNGVYTQAFKSAPRPGWPCAAGTLQGDSGRQGQLFVGAVPLHRAQSRAGTVVRKSC